MATWTEEEYRNFISKSKHQAPEIQGPPKPIIPEPRYRNKTEAAYAQYLDQLKHLKEIIDWKYESLGFRLASGSFHYPDFLVIYRDRIEVHETKGFLRGDSREKFVVAKEMFPWFVWKMIRKEKGQWVQIK